MKKFFLLLCLFTINSFAFDFNEFQSGQAVLASKFNTIFNQIKEEIYLIKNNSLKNYIINGNLDLWQRGTNGNSEYVADRFYCSGSCNRVDISSENDILGSLYGISFNSSIEQRIESLNTLMLEDENLTFSFYYKGSSNPSIEIGIPNSKDSYNSGSSSIISSSSLDIINKGAWKIYSYNFNITKNMAQNGFYLKITTSEQNPIASKIMLHKGNFVSKFMRAGKNIQEELVLAQRYYEKSYNLNDKPGTLTSGGMNYYAYSGSGEGMANLSRVPIHFKTSKRKIPTVIVYSTQSNSSPNKALVNSSIVDATSRWLSDNGGSVGFSAGYNVQFHWTADAEL